MTSFVLDWRDSDFGVPSQLCSTRVYSSHQFCADAELKYSNPICSLITLYITLTQYQLQSAGYIPRCNEELRFSTRPIRFQRIRRAHELCKIKWAV